MRNPTAVARQPAFAVAAYALLLIAAARHFGPDAVQTEFPPPKWRSHQKKQRITTGELIQQLRSEVWSYALEQLNPRSEHFVTANSGNTKPSEPPWPLADAVLHPATG